MATIVIGFLSCLLSSIYSLYISDTNGNAISMNTFQGKKILLVNIATGSDKVDQLHGLVQLQQLYPDSLVVVAFPSNSFGNEARENAEIRQFCQANYNVTFFIASKLPVTGSSIQPVYDWLSKLNENGDMNLIIGGDFQKVLIGTDGTIEGVFSPKVEPLNTQITNLIDSNN